MSGYICQSCRISMRRATRSYRNQPAHQAISRARLLNTDSSPDNNDVQPSSRPADINGNETDSVSEGIDKEHSTSRPQAARRNTKREILDVKTLLSKPSWSVRSLLPTYSDAARERFRKSHGITPYKVRHLLRLSALPLPKTEEEEKKLIETLESQLHFVRNIQEVNTDGVEPLRAIRDETEKGIQEITIGMKELEEAFAKEDIVGKNRRPRRRREEVSGEGVEDWDVFGAATKTVMANGAKYFVVGKPDETEELKGPESSREKQGGIDEGGIDEGGIDEGGIDEGGIAALIKDIETPMFRTPKFTSQH